MLIVAIILIAFIASIQGTCNESCNVPVKHYEEIGCIAVNKSPDTCCPEYFNCAEVMGRATDKCFYKNAVYEKGDEIDDKLTAQNCASSCYCEKSPWKDISCSDVECPEFFGALKSKPNCFDVYEKDSCCSTKTVCPPFDNLAKCEVNGKTYYEGQRFNAPGEACMSCFCQPGFKGKFEEPFCSTVNCGIELYDSDKIRKSCAPVYYGTNKCCPIEWKCFDKDDQFAATGIKSDETCKYGETVLNIGDKLIPKKSSQHSPDINCECRIPPLMTCIQKPYSL